MNIYPILSILFVFVVTNDNLNAQETENSPPTPREVAALLSTYPPSDAFTENLAWHKASSKNEIRMSWFLRGNAGVAMVCAANASTGKASMSREVYEGGSQSAKIHQMSDSQVLTLGKLVKKLPPSKAKPEFKNLVLLSVAEHGQVRTYLYDRLDLPRNIVRIYEVTGAHIEMAEATKAHIKAKPSTKQ